MTFLLRYWPQVLVTVGVLIGTLYWGEMRYESGYNKSEAKWQPKFDAANKALGETNERTRLKDIASKELSEKSEKDHVAQIALRDSRVAAADIRVRQLMRDSAKHARSCELPEGGRSATEPDAAGPFIERSERAGADLVALARRCEEDAAALESLQQWVRQQQALR